VCLDDSATGGGSIAYDSIKQINDTTIAFQRSNFTQDTLVFTYNYPTPPTTSQIFAAAKSIYSIRQMRDTATLCVRVRRSSDNSEQNIGFSGGYIDTTSLKSFVGSGDGFVTIWYDQAGYSNATQATTAQQPRLINNGVVYRSNGEVSLEFGYSGSQRLIHTANYVQPYNIFSVHKLNNATQAADVINDSYNNVVTVTYNRGSGSAPNHRYTMAYGTVLNGTTPVSASITLLSVLASGASSYLRINSMPEVSGNAGTNTLTGLSIGNVRGNPNPVSANFQMKGGISEIIIFDTNQTSNLSLIENNINNFYAIY
jgi:hypothetical protein